METVVPKLDAPGTAPGNIYAVRRDQPVEDRYRKRGANERHFVEHWRKLRLARPVRPATARTPAQQLGEGVVEMRRMPRDCALAFSNEIAVVGATSQAHI